MKMTPIKKLVLCIAAVSVALTIVTTNILTSVFTLKAAQNNIARDKAIADQIAAYNSSGSGSSSGSGNYGTPSNNNSNSSGSYQNPQSSQTPQTPQSQVQNPQNPATPDKPQDSQNPSETPDKQEGGNADAVQGDALKMYVDAINKAKTSATTVVKTKTSASHYQEHLVIEGNAIVKATLEPIGKSLMGTFMKASEPNETIDKNALPPQNIQCTLTAADLNGEPKVEKSGDNTVITLVLKGASDPKAGSGLGSAISIIEEKTITDAVAGAIDISDIHLDYFDSTIIATLDASGNLIGLSVNAPCILKLTAMGVKAEVGIECYDEYTIAY